MTTVEVVVTLAPTLSTSQVSAAVQQAVTAQGWPVTGVTVNGTPTITQIAIGGELGVDTTIDVQVNSSPSDDPNQIVADVSYAVGNAFQITPASARIVANVSGGSLLQTIEQGLSGVVGSVTSAAQIVPWILIGGAVLVILVLASGRKTNLTRFIP